MPGFTGIITEYNNIGLEEIDIETRGLNTRIEKKKVFPNAFVKQSINTKFIEDKIFVENEDYFICIDGVLLNLQEMKLRYNKAEYFTLIQEIYKNSPNSFPMELRGEFSGIVYDKKKETWSIFTNHTGSKWVFYFYDEKSKTLIFGSEVKWVIDGMRKMGIKTELDENGAYCLLTFGYMLSDYTLVKYVKKILPGTILVYRNGKILLQDYYQIRNYPELEIPRRQIINELDARFSAAIKAEYDKDNEYSYSHMLTLSGGLDSRMNGFYARKLGYEKIQTITFSQSGYYDETIAKKIASDWRFDFLFYSLDNGSYLTDIEKMSIITDGLSLFAGSAHSYKMFSLLNWENYGLIHTGQLGDAVCGSYLDNPHLTNNREYTGAYSLKLKEKTVSIFSALALKYTNDELLKFYMRGFNGMFSGYRAAEQFTEYASPFLHIDFLDFALRIPPILRYKEKIYTEWIKTKALEATRYRWEKTGLRLGAKPYHVFVHKAIRYLRKKLFGPSSKDSMNPFDYWYANNPTLRDEFVTYYNTYRFLLFPFSDLSKDVSHLFSTGTLMEKAQVLTLLAFIKLFLSE
jgi:asparagine synthase (glutamine-hydrolysing)